MVRTIKWLDNLVLVNYLLTIATAEFLWSQSQSNFDEPRILLRLRRKFSFFLNFLFEVLGNTFCQL